MFVIVERDEAALRVGFEDFATRIAILDERVCFPNPRDESPRLILDAEVSVCPR